MRIKISLLRVLVLSVHFFLVTQRPVVSQSVFVFKQLETNLTLVSLGVFVKISHMDFKHPFLFKFFQAIGTRKP